MNKEQNVYYFFKQGRGNILAKYLFNEQNDEKKNLLLNLFCKQVITIFFGTIDSEEIKKIYKEYCEIKKDDQKKKRFYEDLKNRELTKNKIGGKRKLFQWKQIFAVLDGLHSDAYFVTITSNTLYIYQLKGDINELEDSLYSKFDEHIYELMKIIGSKYEEQLNDALIKPPAKQSIVHIPKFISIKNLRKFDISEVPQILGSLSSNQEYNRSTCKQIKTEEHLNALKYICNFRKKQQKIKLNKFQPEYLLKHLSPYEFETLIFLLLKNSGLFVPAWRGGTIKGIDFIAYNRTSKDLMIKWLNTTLSTGKSLKIQIKRKNLTLKDVEKLTQDNIILIALEIEDFNQEIERVITAPILLHVAQTQHETNKWLHNSLEWMDWENL